jgi:aspartate/methionine/tyrosine aminotransferase
VFRPLFHNPSLPPPPLVSLTGNHPTTTLSTGSLSKAHGIPGIRLGWIISPSTALLDRICIARAYTTISVSVVDDSIAAFALSREVLPKLLERNLAICQRCIKQLDDFVGAHKGRVDWVRPAGAGTAFIRLLDKDGKPVDDAVVGEKLVNEYGVSPLPGEVTFGDGEDPELRGFFRVTIGDEDKLRNGLELLDGFLKEDGI